MRPFLALLVVALTVSGLASAAPLVPARTDPATMLTVYFRAVADKNWAATNITCMNTRLQFGAGKYVGHTLPMGPYRVEGVRGTQKTFGCYSAKGDYSSNIRPVQIVRVKGQFRFALVGATGRAAPYCRISFALRGYRAECNRTVDGHESTVVAAP